MMRTAIPKTGKYWEPLDSLMTSDTLWGTDMAVMNIRVEGSTALFHMRKSLGKLEALDGKMVYPGHGKPFDDIHKTVTDHSNLPPPQPNPNWVNSIVEIIEKNVRNHV
jgi:hypothetical protein